LNTQYFSDDQAINYLILTLIFIIVNALFDLPLNLYKTFKLDKEYGFSTIDLKTYILDTVKSLVILLLVGAPIIYGVIKIIENFSLWWLYGFIFIFVIVIVINAVYPTLIAPIFNKFKPLENSELGEAIDGLLKSVGFKSSGVFTIDASKRDNRLNAYFGGLGKTKRVVLFDTLVEKLSKNELLAVLGHELGHFKNRDILKNIVISAVMLFVLFFIFGHLPDSFYNEMGLTPTPFSVIAAFMLFAGVFTLFFMPTVNWLSRKNEFAADDFGSQCESEKELASALMKLADENKYFPKAHPLSIFFYYSHPPLVVRLKRLGVEIDEDDSARQGDCAL
jgi:STE24 endopeptidase